MRGMAASAEQTENEVALSVKRIHAKLSLK